jgi:two-component system, sensor histidine kinase and response regulator
MKPLVLIVDDQLSNIILLSRLLEQHCRVFSVTSGQAALDTLLQAPFDLVLLDIMMPSIDGLEVLCQLRNCETTVDLPVILISALSDKKDIIRGLEMGANDYITKPIDIEITLARISTQLRLRQLENERKQALVQLQSAQDMKDRLFRIAAHDIKGPLHNIQLATYLLQKSPESEETVILESINSSIHSMQSVIKDFLDTAAFQDGILNIHLKEVSLRETIIQLTKQYNNHAVKKQISLQLEEIMGTIYADPDRLQQILSNLISNAIKYSPSNSTVRVWTERYAQVIRVCIADEGPGIPEDEQNRLFTPFAKLTPRPTGGESSTGLGLWIVKYLVNLQYGNVGVETSPEGGSIFWVEMLAA